MTPLYALLLASAVACPPGCPCGCQGVQPTPEVRYYNGVPYVREYNYPGVGVREVITPNSYPQYERPQYRPIQPRQVPQSAPPGST